MDGAVSRADVQQKRGWGCSGGDAGEVLEVGGEGGTQVAELGQPHAGDGVWGLGWGKFNKC